MAAGFSEIIMILMLLTGGAGNDALDYMDSDAFWKSKGVTITAQTLATELQVKLDEDPGFGVPPKARHIRLLMAIRTVGEQKLKELAPQLKELKNSKEMFVADYASSALAALEGGQYARPTPSQTDLQFDLNLLPRNVAVVGQAALAKMNGKPMTMKQLTDEVKKSLQNLGAQQPNFDPLAIATGFLITQLEQIGNVRVHAGTQGLADNVGANDGFVVFIMRADYDRAAVKTHLGQMGLQVTNNAEIDTITLGRGEFNMLMPSNDHLILVGGPPTKKLPINEMVAAWKAKVGSLSENTEMDALIKSADRTKPLWFAMNLNETYKKNMPDIAAFDSITGSIDLIAKDDIHVFKLTGKGKEEKKIAESLELMMTHIEEATVSIRKEIPKVPEPLRPIMQTAIDFLESINADQKGGQAVVSGKIKGLMKAAIAAPMLFMSVRQEVIQQPLPCPPCN